jgi:NADH dehydrogenase FAD-containing subunit
MSDKTRVLILGGGFGGLYAVVEFEKRSDLDLTTIVATMPPAP